MPRRYFDKFPIINYNGFNVRDITVSAKLINKYASFPYVYDPYIIDRDQRVDQVASEVHDDQYMSWMLWYANRVVDPYYDWYLSETDFNEFLRKKYGSVPYTFKKIEFWRTNWYEDSREISPDQFAAMFGEYTAPHSYYWAPVYDTDTTRIISYVRRRKDSVVNTNKMCRIGTSNNTFVSGDLVEIRSGGIQVGTAEVVRGDASFPTLSNVIGELDTGFTINLDGNTSSNCSVTAFDPMYEPTDTVWTRVSISPEELVYWSPVTVHDVETEKNEANKTIKVVEPELAIKVSDRLEETLAGRS